MISLHAYRFIDDAWHGGVSGWCRAASDHVLRGGRAWMLTVSDGQANWIKRRLLDANISLFGVQFLAGRSLRRELCQRLGIPYAVLGAETMEFLLRAHSSSSSSSSVARHPGACFSALDDLAAAHWMDDPGVLDDIVPDVIGQWLPELRASGRWAAEVDRRMAEVSLAQRHPLPPLTVCVFGWNAGFWPNFDLLTATLRAADSASVFMPSPRGASESIQQAWLDACEERFGEEFTPCDDQGFASGQSALVERLEGVDFLAPESPQKPILLTGSDMRGTTELVAGHVSRWLLDEARRPLAAASAGNDRLAILCSCRSPSAVAVARALKDLNFAVEDELGEIPEPSLAIQIQRGMLQYFQSGYSLESLLALVDLLNELAGLPDGGSPVLRRHFPIDPVNAARTLRGAFADAQHHDARILGATAAFARSPAAKSLDFIIKQLGAWPESIGWPDALQRWEHCLHGFGLTTEILQPLWSQLFNLPLAGNVPSAAFFHYLDKVLASVPPRRDLGANHRYARVVLTTLEGAAGQAWGGLVFLDANEGVWPLYPPENPFLNDLTRAHLNARRLGSATGWRGHLLTSTDRAQLEQFRFLDTLENCIGSLAFASVASDPADPSKAFYPNEWLLRCLMETATPSEQGESLLARWRHSIQTVPRKLTGLSRAETAHLSEIFLRRRDPALPFDEYFLNFESLARPGELPWTEAWSAGELSAAWNSPAAFALKQIFSAESLHDDTRRLVRAEDWMVGRLVHRWMVRSLNASSDPRRVDAGDWQRALSEGLTRARTETEGNLCAALAGGAAALPGEGVPRDLPLWWRDILRKAAWATRRCLETLSAHAAKCGDLWLCLGNPFQGDVPTPAGPLRLHARCDLTLLDRPGVAGASCWLIDIRTGALPPGRPPTAAEAAEGRGLSLAALLSMAVGAGASETATTAGVVHPVVSNLTMLDHESLPVLRPFLERLARLQRTLIFGQRGPLATARAHQSGESLPLATTPIDPATLEQKARLTST